MSIRSVASRAAHSISNAAHAIPAQYRRWLPMVQEAAKKYHLDPAMLFGVMSRETGGRNIRGDGGHGRGLMQIDDRSWGSWLSSHSGGMDARSNIMKGAEILRANINAFGGNVRAGLAAYNAGPGNVQRALRSGRSPDSVTTGGNYGADVLRRMNQFRGASTAQPNAPVRQGDSPSKPNRPSRHTAPKSQDSFGEIMRDLGKDLQRALEVTMERAIKAEFKELGLDSKVVDDAFRPWEQAHPLTNHFKDGFQDAPEKPGKKPSKPTRQTRPSRPSKPGRNGGNAPVRQNDGPATRSASATMRRLAQAGRSVALSMGGYRGLGRCATGVSAAIQRTLGIKVWGNGNQIDNNLPRSKFREVHMSLAQALKTPGLVLTWEHTSTRLGSIYGHTAITSGDGRSSFSDFVERDTLSGSRGRTGLRIFQPIN